MASIGFPATRDSLIQALAASDPDRSRQAYDALVAAYWKPVYRYLVVVRRCEHDDAEDLTQDFFVHAVARDTLGRYRPEQARFRTFLRVCLDHFTANARKARLRRKRGGDLQRLSVDDAVLATGSDASIPDPEEFFRREWIRALFERGLATLESSYRATGRTVPLAVFLAADVDPADDRRPSYQDLAGRFGVSVTQITNYLAAARRAFRRAVLLELRAGAATDREFRDEARDLFGFDPP